MTRSRLMAAAALMLVTASVSGARANVITYSGRHIVGGTARLLLGQTPADGTVMAGMTTLSTSTGQISGFCVALCQSATSSGRYVMTTPRGQLGAKDANFLADAADLMTWNDPNNELASEATQIALWRLEYDGVTNGVVSSSGTLTVQATNGQVNEMVAADLEQLGYNGGTRRTGPVLSVSELVGSEARANVNLLVVDAARPRRISEPGSLGMVAVAVGGLLGLRRRRV